MVKALSHAFKSVSPESSLCEDAASWIPTTVLWRSSNHQERGWGGRKRTRAKRANEVQTVARVNHQILEWKTL